MSHIPADPVELDPSQPIRIEAGDRDAILNRLLNACGESEQAHNPGQSYLTAWMRVEQAIAAFPLIAGNRLKLLKDGPETFHAMFNAMKQARHHIHLETFILDDEEIGGQLAEILIERAAAGVAVRMVCDAFGALAAGDPFFSRLRENGVQLHKYHPINPFEDIRLWRINNRHHRKIVVIDGRIGFIGGLNISDTYSIASSLSLSGISKGWRDTQVQVQGPGVGQLQRLFITLWSRLRGAAALEGQHYFPQPAAAGGDTIRTVHSTAGDEEARIYRIYLAAIRFARRRIWITQGYFSPDKRFLEALQQAAQRGVDVRLLLPGLTDSWVTISSSRAHYEALLEKGVRVFERKDALQHAKTAVMDGVWSTVGSTNLDYRSFLHANEANVIIWSRTFASEMEELFLEDQGRNREILLENWRRRSWMQKIREFFGSLFDYWL